MTPIIIGEITDRNCYRGRPSRSGVTGSFATCLAGNIRILEPGIPALTARDIGKDGRASDNDSAAGMSLAF